MNKKKHLKPNTMAKDYGLSHLLRDREIGL